MCPPGRRNLGEGYTFRNKHLSKVHVDGAIKFESQTICKMHITSNTIRPRLNYLSSRLTFPLKMHMRMFSAFRWGFLNSLLIILGTLLRAMEQWGSELILLNQNILDCLVCPPLLISRIVILFNLASFVQLFSFLLSNWYNGASIGVSSWYFLQSCVLMSIAHLP